MAMSCAKHTELRRGSGRSVRSFYRMRFVLSDTGSTAALEIEFQERGTHVCLMCSQE